MRNAKKQIIEKNYFAEIVKWFGTILVLIMAMIFMFAKPYSWMIVPITATLAIITILFGYFATMKSMKKNKK